MASTILPSSSSDPAFLSPVSRNASASSVSWPAIFAGATAALAFQVLLMMLGAGLGFALYSPLTDDSPVATLSTGALIVQGLSAVLSLALGGWVAGRFTPAVTRSTGWLHGFSVWCTATVAGVLFVALGAGWALGDLSKVVGGGLSMAGQPAAAAVGGVASLATDAAKQSGDALASFSAEALGNRGTEAVTSESVRAKRELGLAIGRVFGPVPTTDAAADRAALVTAVAQYSGRSPADAERLVAEWTTSFERLKADLAAAKTQAAEAAREAADKAAAALAVFSFVAFCGFLLGAAAATWGGQQGASCATRCENAIDQEEDQRGEGGILLRRSPTV